MSRIAKRPICGNCLKASITRGFVGRIFTRAASPVLRKSGFSAFGAPVFGSRAAMISSKVHATWAVWAWKTGVYPAVMTLGWLRTMICAVKDLATVGGLFVGFGGTVSWFSASTRAGPLYHAILDDDFTMFSPLYELIGMKGTLSTL